jgi:DNA invertase Pin-like site-specific DNA recombinase/transposase
LPLVKELQGRWESPQAFLGNSKWDDIDALVLPIGALLVPVPPKEKQASKIRIAIYARFSTDRQKQSSIVRQVENVSAYYVRIGGTAHVLFKDVGKSAALAVTRHGLQALLEACRKGLFDAVIIENFDRWCREVYDAMEIGEKLEKWKVALHCATLRRALSKDDQIEQARRAENDSRRRTSLTTQGLDQLVDAGGLPWGATFGYRETKIPGFPEIDPVQRLAVVRTFELGLTHSEKETAETLEREKFLNPSGNTRWNASTVRTILSNILYTGRIHYRRTKQTQDRATGTKEYSSRPSSEWVKGTNPDLRIVSDDVFKAVYEARLSRRRRHPSESPKSSEERTNGRVSLFGSPVCDCSAVEGQRFLLTQDHTNLRHSCSLEKLRGGCRSEVASSLKFDFVESAVLKEVCAFLAPKLDQATFKDGIRKRIAEEAANIENRRKALQSEIDETDRKAERLLDQDLLANHSSERIERRHDEIEHRLTELRQDLASLPKFNPEEIDFEGRAAGVKDALGFLATRIPFVPSTENDHTACRLFRRLVKRIVIQRCGRPLGSIGLLIDIQFEALFLDDDALAAGSFPVETLKAEIFALHSYARNEASRDYMNKLASSGQFALTDAQWKLIGPILPPTMDTYHLGPRAVTTRAVADALIFKMRNGMPIFMPPDHFGDRRLVANACLRLIYAGGVEKIVQVLGAADPAWLEGLDIDSVARFQRSVEISKVPRVAIRPIETAGRCAREGTFRLTDRQWKMLEPAVDPRVQQPTGKAARPISARTILDGILIKLRTKCAWHKMPAEFGFLRITALSVAYTGTWDRVVAILQKEFPEVLEGLNTRNMDSLPRSAFLNSPPKASAKRTVATVNSGLLRRR